MSGLAHVALLVREYDEARDWLVERMGFVVTEDSALGGGKRWVTLAPRAGARPMLLLARAVADAQRALVGRQAGGRVLVFVHTRDIERAYAEMGARGVRFVEAPRAAPYGRVAVLEDLYGNRWDLIEPA